MRMPLRNTLKVLFVCYRSRSAEEAFALTLALYTHFLLPMYLEVGPAYLRKETSIHEAPYLVCTLIETASIDIPRLSSIL